MWITDTLSITVPLNPLLSQPVALKCNVLYASAPYYKVAQNQVPSVTLQVPSAGVIVVSPSVLVGNQAISNTVSISLVSVYLGDIA